MWHIAGIEVIDDLHPLVVLMLGWTALAFIVILLRIYTRAVLVRQLGADDWLMAMAMVLSIGTLVGAFYQIKYGMGEVVNPGTITAFLHSLFATFSIYLVAQTLYKLSIAVQCYRLFSTTLGRHVVRFLIIWITICGITTFCGSTFYCFPMRKAWDDAVGGWCVDRAKIYYCGAALNILNDIFLIAIPIPFLVKLHVAPKQKVILLSIFTCGIIVTVVSVVRLRALLLVQNDVSANDSISVVQLCLWSALELNLAIICGSIPALKAFFDRVILRRKGTNVSSTHDSRQQRTDQTQRCRVNAQSNQDEESGTKNGIELRSKPVLVTDDTGSDKGLIVQDPLPSPRPVVVEPRRGLYGVYPCARRERPRCTDCNS